MRRVDVRGLLEALAIRATRKGKKWEALCPNPDHPDSKPSWSIVDDPASHRHGSHNCFACGFHGGPWELVEAVRGLSLQDAGKWIRALQGGELEVTDADLPVVRLGAPADRRRGGMELPLGVVIPSATGEPWYPRAAEYLVGRGIPTWQRDRWRMGFAIRGRCAMRVFVPVVTGGVMLSYVARAFGKHPIRYDAARRDDPGARPEVALFGEPAFEPLDEEGRRGTCVVTEGVFKALAFERIRAPNPCATLGATNLGPEKVAMLATFRRVLIGTDPDPAGDRAAEVLGNALCRHSEVKRLDLELPPDDATDEQNRAALVAATRRRKLRA